MGRGMEENEEKERREWGEEGKRMGIGREGRKVEERGEIDREGGGASKNRGKEGK